MPWPRGVPRKGHVNKSGEPHGRVGRKPKVVLTLEAMERSLIPTTINFSTDADHPQKRTTMKRAVAKPVEAGPKKTRKYTTKLAHPQYSVEPCPNCDFAEADGGHCPECGWTQALVRQPANSVHGRSFKR